MTIAQDLLDILRCPHCARTAPRNAGETPGRLLLVRDAWLVCQEPCCDRKFPIRAGIPDLRLDDKQQWRAMPVEQLPVPPAER